MTSALRASAGGASCRALVLALAQRRARSRTPIRGRAMDRKVIWPRNAGQQIGRYVILRKRSAKAAWAWSTPPTDPELDVARRPSSSVAPPTRPPTREVQERLLREAQAMARVAHPSVVTVHDVGRYDDQVFVAMELIDGETLAMWLWRLRRARRARWSMFVRRPRVASGARRRPRASRLQAQQRHDRRAGAGAGDGLRFGAAGRPAREHAHSPSPSRLDGSLTGSNVERRERRPTWRSEQLALGPADARTDEFSGVALYEALAAGGRSSPSTPARRTRPGSKRRQRPQR